MKFEECNVKCEESVCLTVDIVAPGSRAGHVLGQQQLFLVVFLKCEVWTVKCGV